MTTRYHDFMIFGSHSVYCGLCHGSPETCRCDVSFLQRYAIDTTCSAACHTADQELAARRAVVAQANAPAVCSCCGQPLPPTVPPAQPGANVAGEAPPSGYMSRDKLL